MQAMEHLSLPLAPQSLCERSKQNSSPTSIQAFHWESPVMNTSNFLPRLNRPVSYVTKFRETHNIRSTSPSDFSRKDFSSPNEIIRKRFKNIFASQNPTSADCGDHPWNSNKTVCVLYIYLDIWGIFLRGEIGFLLFNSHFSHFLFLFGACDCPLCS